MNIEILKSDIETVNYIIHISDIHIRLYKRHDEYVGVFNRLFLDIKSRGLKNAIIVLSGDIIHTKQENAPEQYQLVSDFLRNCQELHTTILIAGNHDANLANKNRMDSLSPIVNNGKFENLFYLKYSGLYQLGNIVFSNMSVFDTNDKYVLGKDINTSLKKVALYHGPVNGASTDVGFNIVNDKMPINMFYDFDAAILGDIHKYQNLKSFTQKNISNIPNIIYASSLLQQNYGESLDNHGYVLWNTNDFSYEFIPVENEFGYLTLEIDNGKILTNITDMPVKPRMRLKVTNTSGSELKECLIQIRQQYKPEELIVSRAAAVADKNLTDELDLSNIRDVEFQNALIKDYISRNFNVDDATVKEICEINSELNSQLPTEDVIRNITWKPKIFKFSNMFSYGEENVVDFSKMGGIVGLFNANASGKSSMLESLTFCLFDKCAKAFKANHIMNSQKKEFWCELNFEIDGIDFFIKKTAVRSKSDKVSVRIEFYKIDNNGERVDLNGDARRDTAALIRSYIGDYEDFNLTALSSQNNHTNFIEMGQSDRKDLLTQFMDISVFDKLSDLGNAEIKEYSVLLKQFEKRNFDQELLEIESKLDESRNQYSMCQLSKTGIIESRDEASSELLSLTKQIVPVESVGDDIETLEYQQAELGKMIQIADAAFDKMKLALLEKEEECNTVKKSLDLLNSKTLKTDYDELVELEKEETKLQTKFDKMKVEVKHKLDKAAKLLQLEYDPDCNFCMNNIFVKDAINAKADLENDKKEVHLIIAKLDEVKSKISEKSHIRQEYSDLEKKQSEYNTLKMKVLSLNSEKVTAENKLIVYRNKYTSLGTSIDTYYKSKEDIENNKVIEKQIESKKLAVSNLDYELRMVEKTLLDFNSKVMLLEERKSSTLKSVEDFSKMEDKHAAYQYYLSAIGRDNIPYELIAKSVPQIETEINNILSQIVDFSILLDLDGKNVNAKIVYDENKYWPIELASGMEKFVTGLAIRVALINISNLPRPTFLALDEGFSSLDGDNMSNLPVMFDYLKTQFDFVLVISHIDHIRDFVDISLDLQKDGDFSKITFE